MQFSFSHCSTLNVLLFLNTIVVVVMRMEFIIHRIYFLSLFSVVKLQTLFVAPPSQHYLMRIEWMEGWLVGWLVGGSARNKVTVFASEFNTPHL